MLWRYFVPPTNCRYTLPSPETSLSLHTSPHTNKWCQRSGKVIATWTKLGKVVYDGGSKMDVSGTHNLYHCLDIYDRQTVSLIVGQNISLNCSSPLQICNKNKMSFHRGDILKIVKGGLRTGEAFLVPQKAF